MPILMPLQPRRRSWPTLCFGLAGGQTERAVIPRGDVLALNGIRVFPDGTRLYITSMVGSTPVGSLSPLLAPCSYIPPTPWQPCSPTIHRKAHTVHPS